MGDAAVGGWCSGCCEHCSEWGVERGDPGRAEAALQASPGPTRVTVCHRIHPLRHHPAADCPPSDARAEQGQSRHMTQRWPTQTPHQALHCHRPHPSGAHCTAGLPTQLNCRHPPFQPKHRAPPQAQNTLSTALAHEMSPRTALTCSTTSSGPTAFTVAPVSRSMATR